MDFEHTWWTLTSQWNIFKSLMHNLHFSDGPSATVASVFGQFGPQSLFYKNLDVYTPWFLRYVLNTWRNWFIIYALHVDYNANGTSIQTDPLIATWQILLFETWFREVLAESDETQHISVTIFIQVVVDMTFSLIPPLNIIGRSPFHSTVRLRWTHLQSASASTLHPAGIRA